MCNLVLVLLVALYSTSPVLGQNISRKEEEGCTLSDRSRGVCKPSSECLHGGTNSTECSIRRGIVYVCCEPAKTGSSSQVVSGKTIESPRKVELNETAKTGNSTSGDKIAERFFFFDEPISENWGNKDNRRVQHNYNHFREEERNPFRDIDVDSFEIVPVDIYNVDGNKEEKNVNYEWENNRRRTERPYDPGYESYEKHGRKKYPWENNQRTTVRPSTPTLFYYEEKEDQEYPWNSNRRTTERPYNPGFNYYEQEQQKNPWNSNRRTTERPYNPGFNYYEHEQQKNPANSNRRTTERPYNPGFGSNEKQGSEKYPWETGRRTTVRPSNPTPNYYEEKEDQEYPWNSNRRTTERPFNPGLNYFEQEQQKNPWNSNRRTTERPYNPGLNYFEQEQQKNPWNSNRRTTERPYNPGSNYYEQEQQKNPWNSNRRTTERPYNPGFGSNEKQGSEKYSWETSRRTTVRPSNPTPNYYEEKEDQEYPWNTNRRTTERPRPTRRTTESPPKKQTLDPDRFFFSDNEKRRRISKTKCEEYSEIVTQTISGLPLIPDPSPIKIKVDECKNFQSLIVGGTNTSLGEFPHMAAIGFFDRAKREMNWHCGGSLISDRYVLSAAHCTISKFGKPVRIRLGDYNLKSEDDGAQPEEYTIADIIVHPDYKQPVKYNDIALFRLSERVNFRKDIRPACLYTEFNIPHPTATAIGWGRLHRTNNLSDVLQKVSLDIIDNKSCRKPYNNTNSIQITGVLPQGIIESQLCAGDLAGKRDTCQGDSGGPLEILSDRNLCVHYVIGITSFGKSCASLNSPGVYTRVSSYIPWIESIVWPGQ